MKTLYEQCAERMKEVSALAQAAGIVSWDQETMMPERGIGARAAQLEALSAIIHEKATDPRIGDMLRTLSASPADLDDDQRACVREWLIDYEKATKLPPDLVREMASTTALAHDVWIKARRASDFGAFAPWLTKIVALKKRQAECMGYTGVPYDALLDDYEPGATCAAIDPIFQELRAGLVRIVEAIRDSGVAIDAGFMKRRYPEKDQEEIAREVMTAIGVDPAASRLDRSAHPFSCGIAPTDVRITTRYDERHFTESLFGVIHESGHALYSQGLDDAHLGTPLCESISVGIHESQSRLWENIVGRGRPFVSYLLPRLKKRFGRQLRGVGVDGFYRAINRVEPSLIRTKADEVTYNLHVILRYEIEKALIAGEIAVQELPGIWNEKMETSLGVRPTNDAEGILQDVHWSQGSIGYFPTYALGNLYAAQWWNRLRKDVRGVDRKIERGAFAPILAWLRQQIHRHGRRYSASELVQRATGEPLRASPFLDYLTKKYGEIYRMRMG